MNPDLRPCWRCKKPFYPEASEFWPNIKETCPDCVRAVLPATATILTNLARMAFNGLLVADVIHDKPCMTCGQPTKIGLCMECRIGKAPEVAQAELIIKERGRV